MVIQNSAGFHVPCSNKQRACMYKAQTTCQGDPETPLKIPKSNAGGYI